MSVQPAPQDSPGDPVPAPPVRDWANAAILGAARLRNRAERVLRTVWALRPWAPSSGAAAQAAAPAYYRDLLNELASPAYPPLPLDTAVERLSFDEASVVRRVARIAASAVIENYCRARAGEAMAPARRDQHAKQHGCLRAVFTVAPELEVLYAAGVFQPGMRYEALVRFSNAGGTPERDRKRDGRGMAIKLRLPNGRTILDGLDAGDHRAGAAEQDFLLTNDPVFFGRNVSDYARFMRIVHMPSDGRLASVRKLLAFSAFFAVRPRQLWIFWRTALRRTENPLTETYHSMTAYRLGDRSVVRYLAVPAAAYDLASDRAAAATTSRPDYLRERMVSALSLAGAGGAAFDFLIQVRDAAASDDVEDASRPWRGARDVTVPLGRLEIPPQDFDRADERYVGETLSFNPWNCLPEHRPLGGLNRMRLAVYLASARVRHRLNMVTPPRIDRLERLDEGLLVNGDGTP